MASRIPIAAPEPAPVIERERSYECQIGAQPILDDIIGDSLALRTVLGRVVIAAPTDCTILIQGETGAVKELFVHSVHKGGSQRDGPVRKLTSIRLRAT